MATEAAIAAGRAALRAGLWSDAEAAYRTALGGSESPEAAIGLGEALWWLGHIEASVEHYERAYAGFRQAGNQDSAAWAALWLGLAYGYDFGNAAAFRGWVARAERLLQRAPASRMRGWLRLVQAYGTADPARSQELAERALEHARGGNDPDLELCALAHLGKVLVSIARVEEGLALVDEAMVGTFGGERARLDTVVFTSCSMINACGLAADLERATQWCSMADDFVSHHGCPFLHVQCRVGYGSILLATGRWEEAERQLGEALRLTRKAYPPFRAQALARLAELRVEQGRLEEAEELLADGAEEASLAVAEAKAKLARGEGEVAVAVLQRRLGTLSRRPVELASALSLLMEGHLVAGRNADAEAVADQLASLARQHGHALIAAQSEGARGRLMLSGGRYEAAIASLEMALERYGGLPLPLETAHTRLDLARALAPGNRAVAIVEARRALSSFDRLGATLRADQAAALLRSLGASRGNARRGSGVLTKRELEVFRLLALGLSNPEIAERLSITRKTVAHHVSSVLSKIGLRSRGQVAAYAHRAPHTPWPGEDGDALELPERLAQ